jgi:hypothetical protein
MVTKVCVRLGEVAGSTPIESQILININHHWPMGGCHVATSQWSISTTCQHTTGPLGLYELPHHLANLTCHIICLSCVTY